MRDRTYVNPPAISRPRGYTHVVKAGDTAYLAGQIAVAADGSIVGAGDAEAQVRQIWRNIEAAVRSVGGSLADVVKTTTYVTDIAHATAVRKVRDEIYAADPPPTSTLLVVAGLAHPELLVEIEAVAVVSS